MEGLRTEADAIDAGGEPGGRFFRRDGFGIGFEGHFGAGRTGSRGAGRTCSRGRCGGIGAGEVRTHRVENAREIGGIEEAGRAAAQVDCVDFFIAKSRVDFVDARKLLMSMTFARRHGLLAFDNASHGSLDGFEMRGGFEICGGVQRAPIADFALHGARVGRIGRARSDSGMKITVGALGLAEGHLDVDSEDFFRREKRRDFFDARKLLMSMAFARRNGLFALDNADHGLLNPPQPAAKVAWTLLLHESSSCRWLSREEALFCRSAFLCRKNAVMALVNREKLIL